MIQRKRCITLFFAQNFDSIIIIHVFFRRIIAKQIFQRLVKLNTGSLKSLSRFLWDERTIPRYRSKMKSKFTKVVHSISVILLFFFFFFFSSQVNKDLVNRQREEVWLDFYVKNIDLPGSKI